MSDPLYDHIDSVLEPRAFTPSPALVASVEAYLESLKQPRVYFERVTGNWYTIACGDIAIIDKHDEIFDTLSTMLEWQATQS